jgi:hypothetical protein
MHRDLLRGRRLRDRLGKPLARVPRMSLGVARKACGEIGRGPLRESGKIGRGGERGFEQRARFWRLGDEGRSGREIGGVAKRLVEALENVGAPRRIVNARGLGDALDERGYAALVSDPACS